MATIINDRDKILQAAIVRLEPVGGNYIYLTPNNPVFKTTNAGVAPASYTLTANLTGYLAGTVTFAVSSGTATLTNVTGNTCTLTFADMTSDSAVVTATLVHLGSTYTASTTFTKINDVVVVSLSSDTINIPTDANGDNAVYTNANTSVSVSVGNKDDTSNWLITKSVTSGTATLTGTGGTINVTAITTDSATVTIKANKTGYAEQTKVLTINKVKAAAASLTISLVKPVHALSALQDGSGYTLPTGNYIRLYKGPSILTSDVVYGPATTTKGGLTLTVNTATGAMSLSGIWTTDSEEFPVTAIFNSITYTTTYSIAKAKSGTIGGDGDPGATGSRGAAVLTSSSTTDYSSYKGSTYSTGSALGTALAAAISTAYSINPYADRQPRAGDRVTLYGTGWSNNYLFDGSSWSYVSLMIDGSLVVTGTIATSSLVLANTSTSSRVQLYDNKIEVWDTGTRRVVIGAI
jgi:hypothetical protein